MASRRARVAELDRGAETLFERVEADAARARVLAAAAAELVTEVQIPVSGAPRPPRRIFLAQRRR